MDNSTTGSRNFFLKPAKSGLQKIEQQNGSSIENGNSITSLSNASNNNPFLKCEKEESETPKDLNDKDPAEKKEIKTSDLFKPANTNLFVKNATLLSENSNFVFGQNLHERVVIDKVNDKPAASDDGSESKINSSKEETKETTAATSANTSNSASNKGELLFSSALSSSNSDQDLANNANSTQPIAKPSEEQVEENLSLIEAARRYEEIKSSQKRKYEEVVVFTGEENDKNILEINCKLFTFVKNNWEERGRGMLRLNDCKNCSRVVFRTSGNLRVLLNTKVWRDQMCEQSSSKTLKFTAIDANGLVKIYLVSGRTEDIDNLYLALSTRIRNEKDRTPEPEEMVENKNDEGEEDSSTNSNDSQEKYNKETESDEPVPKKIAATLD